jgi:2-dehydro-3-deoxyphosphooctonate aldolase (KDO 8-P synthase)
LSAIREVEVGGAPTPRVTLGYGRPLTWITGPCVIEDRSLMAASAECLKKLSEKLEVPLIFKSSYEKDNRTTEESYRGPGIDEGLEMLAWIRHEFELPVLADVHRVEDLPAAREVLDVIQIPAFLCQQTSLVVAAGQTGKPINVKKAQFLAPEAMSSAVGKIERTGNRRVLLTERGTCHGYSRFLADMTAIPAMQEIGYPVIFDAGHQVRRYGIPSVDPGGNAPKEYIPILLRAGVAAGANGIFLETHPNPADALCDAGCQFPLGQLEDLMLDTRDLAELIRAQGHA